MNHYKTKLGVALASLFISASSFALDTLKDPKATKENAKQVMEYVEKNEFVKVFESLKKYWPADKKAFDKTFANTLRYRSIVEERWGNTVGVEFIRTDTVGKSLVKHRYIERLEKHAMRWEFTYYKGKDGWILNKLNMDDKLEVLF